MHDPGTSQPQRRPRWYVIQSKPRQENRALEHLRRQGFTCYLPTLAVEKLRNGRKIETHESLFPGYLFVELDDVNDNWYPIKSTRGVSQFVRFNDRLLPLENEILAVIRARLAGNRPHIPYLQPGERVVVTEGAFAQLEAIFLANDGAQRVVLLMNILHSEQTLSFPLASVRKCVNRFHGAHSSR